jgi:hypothetical protein
MVTGITYKGNAYLRPGDRKRLVELAKNHSVNKHVHHFIQKFPFTELTEDYWPRLLLLVADQNDATFHYPPFRIWYDPGSHTLNCVTLKMAVPV